MLRLFFFLTFVNVIRAQSDPSFEAFIGQVYEIPAKTVMNAKFAYSEDILNFEKLETVTLDAINIPNRETSIPFPGVDRTDRYGMILNSEMKISKSACYTFELSSDDGSKLWLGESLRIDNDGTHKMRSRRDTVFIAKGSIPVKLWYYQGFPNKYGIILDAKYYGPTCPITKDTLSSGPSRSTPIRIKSSVLFDLNSSELNEKSNSVLDSLISEIQASYPKEIMIVGHTCDKGSNSENFKLSKKRANAIQEYFLKNPWPKVIFKSIGKGEELPLVANENEDNRKLNRRVEIFIK